MVVGCTLRVVVGCKQWGWWEVLVQCGGHVDGKVGVAGSNQFGCQSGMVQVAAHASQGRALVNMCGLGKRTRIGGRIVLEQKWRQSLGKIFGQNWVWKGALGMVWQVQWLAWVVKIWKVWNHWEAGQARVEGRKPVGWQVKVA